MKAVTRYETEDGKSFKTEEDALKHERTLRCEKKYEDNRLSTYPGGWVSWEDISQWLDSNSELVADYLGWC